MAQAVPLTGSFAATGQSAAVSVYGQFNVTLRGTFVGTVKLQRSFDGETWDDCARDSEGTLMSWTAPYSGQWFEPEKGVAYRLNCTAYTSGTISYRISQ